MAIALQGSRILWCAGTEQSCKTVPNKWFEEGQGPLNAVQYLQSGQMNFATTEEGRIERRARLGVAILTQDVVAKRRQPQTNQQKGSRSLDEMPRNQSRVDTSGIGQVLGK